MILFKTPILAYYMYYKLIVETGHSTGIYIGIIIISLIIFSSILSDIKILRTAIKFDKYRKY